MRRRRVRLVQITHGMGIGGMERVIVELCKHLDPARYDISVYCTHILGPLASELGALNVPVYHRPIRRRVDHWVRPARILRFLREHRPDVVHTQHMAAFLDTAVAARAAGVPVLVHTDHSKRYPEKKRYMIAERLLSNITDVFCAVSEHTRRDISTYEGIPYSRIRVVYNGIELLSLPGPEDRREVREMLGVGERTPLVGAIARLEWQKGHDLFLEAMPRVLERIPDARGVIVGGGSKQQELLERVRDLGLEGKVRLVGPRTDPLRFMEALDLFLMTSHFEGMPVALLEAMALSKPVLASAVGGVPEVVTDGETGLLFSGRDPGALADRIVELLRDPELLRRYGTAGRESYERRFRVGPMVRNYDEIYTRCLQDRLWS